MRTRARMRNTCHFCVRVSGIEVLAAHAYYYRPQYHVKPLCILGLKRLGIAVLLKVPGKFSEKFFRA